MENTTKTPIKGIKKSKALYAMTIYGFIVLFVALLLPFIPFNVKYGSFMKYGFEYMQFHSDFMSAFLPIAMIANTVLIVIMSIVFINRLRNFRAGVARNIFNFFRISIVLFLTIALSYLLFVKDYELFENYTIVYWYVVLGMYGGIMIFALFAHLSSKTLRADRYKAMFYWIGTLLILLIMGLAMLRTSTVVERYTRADLAGKGINYAQSIKNIWFISNIFISVLMVAGFISLTHSLMPLNQPFQYSAYRNLNRDKNTKLSIVSSVFFVIFGFAFNIVYPIFYAKHDVLCPLLLMGYGVLKIAAAMLYNKYEVISEAKKEEKPLGLSYEGSFFQKQEDLERQEEKKKYCWTLGELDTINRRFAFKSKTTVAGTSETLMKAISSKGVQIEPEDEKKVLSSVLSSKVTFIRGETSEKTITAFADGLARYFGEDLFIEHRKKEVIEESIKVSTPTYNNSLSQFSSFNFSNEQNKSEEEGNSFIPAEKEEKKEPTEIEKMIAFKYGIKSGLFVANALDNTLGLVFLDLTNAEKIDSDDSDMIDAIINNDEDIFINRSEYLPETDYCFRSTVKNCDNLRLIVFISKNNKIKLKPDWIKYASILDMNLFSNSMLINSERFKVETSFRMINSMLEEAQSNYYLSEEYWRKIDILEQYLFEHMQIKFDNRLTRQMEQNIALFIASGLTSWQALDTVLSEKILPFASLYKDKIKNLEEFDLEAKLESVFGFENIPLTKKAVSIYGFIKE